MVRFDEQKIQRITDISNLIKRRKDMLILGKGWGKMFIAKQNHGGKITLSKHMLENNLRNCPFYFAPDKINAASFVGHMRRSIAKEK